MNSALLKSIEGIVVERLLSNNVPFTGKSKLGIGLYAFFAFMFFSGIVFLLYAWYLWLNTTYPAEVAALTTGLSSIGFALVSLMVGNMILSNRRRKAEIARQKTQAEMTEAIQNFVLLAAQDFETPVRENPKTAVAAASIIGFVAGEFL